MTPARRVIVALVLAAVLLPIGLGVRAQPRRPGAELVVVVRVEALEDVPRCGDVWVAPVARHSVLRVERGRYTRPTLYAFHDCGQVSGRWPIAVGAVFRLWLSRRAPAQFGAPTDSMADRAVPRYFVLRGQPATP